MKQSAYLVNTSRGPVVDEQALAWALQQHLIAGSCSLDVYEHEPAVHPDPIDSGECSSGAAPGQRHDRNQDGHGAPGGRQRRGGADRSSATSRRRMKERPRGAAGGRRACDARCRAIDGLELPAVEKISESQEENPFHVLATLPRPHADATTLAASTRLFRLPGRRAVQLEADRPARSSA